MQEKPKEDEEVCEGKTELPDARDNWAADQEHRSYYYDDAHGYEEFRDTDESDESAEKD